MNKICVLGAGAWGTAISQLLADNGHQVNLWCHESKTAKNIFDMRINERFLPGVVLSQLINPVTDFQQALQDAAYIFEAIPVQFLHATLENVRPFITKKYTWVVLSKGIEQNTLLFPTGIIDDVLGNQVAKAALLGPSYAQDLAQKKLTGVTLAVTDKQVGDSVANLLANNYFKPFLSFDMMGAQAGAAFKNMAALFIGALAGLGVKDNTKALILTRMLAEMAIISTLFGGKTETIYGLAGVGDVILTALGKYSKNQQVGNMLAQGYTLDDILKKTQFIPEGVNTALACQDFLMKHAKQLPIFSRIPLFIQGLITVDDVLTQMIELPISYEHDYS